MQVESTLHNKIISDITRVVEERRKSALTCKKAENMFTLLPLPVFLSQGMVMAGCWRSSGYGFIYILYYIILYYIILYYIILYYIILYYIILYYIILYYIILYYIILYYIILYYIILYYIYIYIYGYIF